MTQMSDLFYDAYSIDYPIIDSDAHVNEPPDLWQDRVPAKWKARAPKVLQTDEGDIWSFDDGREKWPMGLTATAGLSFFQFSPLAKAAIERCAPLRSTPRRVSAKWTPMGSMRRCCIRA